MRHDLCYNAKLSIFLVLPVFHRDHHTGVNPKDWSVHTVQVCFPSMPIPEDAPMGTGTKGQAALYVLWKAWQIHRAWPWTQSWLDTPETGRGAGGGGQVGTCLGSWPSGLLRVTAMSSQDPPFLTQHPGNEQVCLALTQRGGATSPASLPVLQIPVLNVIVLVSSRNHKGKKEEA